MTAVRPSFLCLGLLLGLHMDTILGMTVPAAQMKMPLAPHLTVEKHATLQMRRVDVVVEYAGDEGSARRASEACDIVKELCPDVKTRTLRMPSSSKPTNLFRLRIDGKTVEQSTGNSAFLSAKRIEEAVAEARRKRRPQDHVYTDIRKDERVVGSAEEEAVLALEEDLLEVDGGAHEEEDRSL